MDLLGSEDESVFTLTKADIIRAIAEFIESRYSIPNSAASIIVSAMPATGDMSAVITLPISILEVSSKEKITYRDGGKQHE